ncbi:polysaccharide biosynthesis tyrosine autokinase [Komarekiella sp. 'clone 1']|uniref:non-specific protein-tyrosine kinase n=1 Tax=Komarekiella delphini-convector SJRDD-AB1 TaxID=2593771 RepID=A0AA40T2Z9_9NOST|nr:polysaccharide biosynthesis tyrosine autokinase [Komarekiella delphini-convector]MBD6619941.1 polysaccharide biosynthesis tyrosine autokinase [Komarekiella delphini-convector SJRDD-AB1]
MDNKNYPDEINIQKYLLVFKRRWLIVSGVFVAFAALGGANFFMQPTTYEASGKLMFQLNRTSSLTGVGEKIGHLESIGSNNASNPLDTQALLVQSETIKQDVIKTLKLEDQTGKPLKPESLAIEVERIIGTDGFNISHISEDPKMATDIVNEVMNSYIANNIITNRSEAIAAGTFIQKQLPRAKIELDMAAEALRRFKTQNQVIDLQEETSGTVKAILALDEELNNARSQLADLSTQEKQIRRQLNLKEGQAVDITSLSQASGVQEVLAELQKVQTQLANQRARYTERNPSIINLKSQEIALKSLLQQRTAESLGYKIQLSPNKLQMGKLKQDLASDFVKLQSQRLGLEKKIASISSIRQSYAQRADVMPNLEKMEGELSRNLLVSQKSYENLLTRLQEIKVAENQTIGNARVLQYAEVGSNPAATKRKMLILIGGGFVGLLLGVAAALFIDLIDRSVKTSKEAEELFGYTLLGLIPTFESNNNTSEVEDTTWERVSRRVIVATYPRSIVHEAYQMLQANLKFISLDKKVRTIVVTSSVAGEGKSEISANLAMAMAQAGRRVLLVDADMRQPSQHHFWGLINSVGLSNVMVGQDEFSQIVQQITPNLSVLTAGVIPPNPLALIDSERMTTLIDQLSQQYDYIIFDTPHLMGTAEAAVLGKMADGVLVVIRPGVVDSTSVAAAKSLLSLSEANILGIVANAVNVKQEPDNYFYYNSPRAENSVEKVDTAPLS